MSDGLILCNFALVGYIQSSVFHKAMEVFSLSHLNALDIDNEEEFTSILVFSIKPRTCPSFLMYTFKLESCLISSLMQSCP